MADIVLNTGDTAWVLASTALVLLMTPGLALFYGGMVRAKSVLNMMLMSMVTIGIVSVLWVIYGFKLAFGYEANSQWYGAISLSGLGSAVNELTNNKKQFVTMMGNYNFIDFYFWYAWGCHFTSIRIHENSLKSASYVHYVRPEILE